MEILRSAAPDPRLAPFVRAFVHREILPGSKSITQPIIATVGPILGFELGDPLIQTPVGGKPFPVGPIHLWGTQTKLVGYSELRGCLLEFGIFLRPMACWQLFGVPPAELTDRDGDPTALLGSWVAELWSRLREARSFSQRVSLANERLLGFVPAVRRLSSLMSTAHLLFPSNESARIVNIARQSAMSTRNYERLFLKEIGCSPKTFVRLARFDRAVDLKRRGRNSWTNISHDLGYFDQMHMIRDFRQFGGDTPGRLVLPDSDIQPWSALGSDETAAWGY